MEIPRGKVESISEHREFVFDSSLCLHFLQVLQEARDYLFQKINSETLHGANGIKLKILRS